MGNSDKNAPDDLGHSPNYGCAIGIIAAVVFSTLIGMTVYTGYRQNKEIDMFALPEPLKFSPEFSSPERVSSLRESFREFGRQISKKQPASISLSAQDLNDLLGHEPKLFPIRDMIHFIEIRGDTATAQVSFPMRTLFRGGKFRYLNGTASFQPVIQKGRLKLLVPAIESDKGEVPDGFVEMFSDSNLLHPYREDPELAPLLESITGVRIENDRIHVDYDPTVWEQR